MKTLLIKSVFIASTLFFVNSFDASATGNGNYGGGSWLDGFLETIFGSGNGHSNGHGNGHGYDNGPGQGPGNGNGYGHNGGGKTNAPIDGGLSLLIAAGAGLGIKKARDRRKGEKNSSEQANDIL